MLGAIGWVFSLWSLLAAMIITFAIWHFLNRPRKARYLGEMVKTLFPVWAVVISVFTYGAQALSSEAQNDLIAAELERNDILRADVRGMMAFVARQDEGDVILKKADGKEFEVEKLRISANYQADRDEGPKDSDALPVEPDYMRAADGDRAVRISRAKARLCDMDVKLCGVPIRWLTLEFIHAGMRYRVVATP